MRGELKGRLTKLEHRMDPPGRFGHRAAWHLRAGGLACRMIVRMTARELRKSFRMLDEKGDRRPRGMTERLNLLAEINSLELERRELMRDKT